MSTLFEVRENDRIFYEKHIRDFVPDELVDFHVHIWLAAMKAHRPEDAGRVAGWPARVAGDNSAEDLAETYRLMFPGKRVTPLVFTYATPGDDLDRLNRYVSEHSRPAHWPALIWPHPDWSADELDRKITEGGFAGAKPYLNFAPAYVPARDIRIYDFVPRPHLEVLNRRGLVLLLHLPRPARLRDSVNLAQIREIEKIYPNLKLVVAHVGRAYCPEDVGDAWEVVAGTERIWFDISANTNAEVFAGLIRTVGSSRVLFGSDLPITRMRMRRVCESGNYVNLVPPGLYGDVSGDRHMREVDGIEAARLTFFLYEEMDAFRRAAEETGLIPDDLEKVFFRNARSLMASAGRAPTAQLQMIWPAERMKSPLPVTVPNGHILRSFVPGDEEGYITVMRRAGFETWGREQLEQTLKMALPGGIFLVIHEHSGSVVATAAATHSPSQLHPHGGELGWVAVDPDHRGKKLGEAVCAAVINRFRAAGYRDVYLRTDDWRLPAIRVYLKQGWMPFLFAPEMKARWQNTCGGLHLDFSRTDCRTPA